MKFFKTLRAQMILISIIMVNIPLLFAGYMMKQNAEYHLLEEKRNKLAAFTLILDSSLDKEGYEGILRRKGAERSNLSKQEKISLINEDLVGITDEIAASSKGLGVGFYSRDLDAIVAYGPSRQFGYTVGWPIQETHPGRQVMAENMFRVEFGTLVRGNIMNAMHPLVRNGQVIGYIWANELTDDVKAQLEAMDIRLIWTMFVGLLLSFVLSLLFTERVVGDVQSIIKGLAGVRFDLSTRITTGLRGELGKIAVAINDLAEALGDARSLSENIMDSMPDGIIAVDTHGRIMAVNKAAEFLTGFESKEIVGELYATVFCRHPAFHSLLLDTLATGEPHLGGELDYPVKYGTVWVNSSTSLLRNLKGDTIGAVVVLEDLSERKRLEAQVNRADRLATLGELMSGIAHEIRNPLTGIQGFLQYFQQADSEEERQTYIPIMLQEAERMNRIIESLLYFSRPCEPVIAPADLCKVLREAVLLLKNKASQQNIVFHFELEESIPMTEIDEGQFKQVFLNLLINAVQALQDGGIISIYGKFLEDKDALEIIIADNGPGIPAENREKVFDPFFTTKNTGTGLGMSVVQRIILAQKGQIFLEDNPGGGTLVRLIIPRQRKVGVQSGTRQ